MDIAIHLGDREHHVQGADDVVRLGVHRVLAIDHRVRSGALLGVVHDRAGPKPAYRVEDELGVAQVADKQFELVAGDLAPHLYPVAQRLDGHQTL